MKMRILVAALWSLSLVVVYSFARRDVSVEPAPPPSDPVSARNNIVIHDVSTQAPTQSARSNPAPSPAASSNSATASVTTGGGRITSGSMQRTLSTALESKDPISRNLEIAQMIAGLDANNVQAALQAFQDAPRNRENEEYFRLFMHAWGQIDGKAALDFAFNSDDPRRFVGAAGSAMSSWAATDPNAALDYLENGEFDDRARGYMRDSLVRGWAGSDLYGASSYVSTLGEGDQRNRLSQMLVDQYLEQDGPAGAMRWAEDVARNAPDDQYRSVVMNRVADRIAQSDPETAANWVDQELASGAISSRTLGEIASEWGERDPVMAASWLESHFDDQRVNGDVVAGLARQWAREDPVAAAGWVDQYLGNDRLVNREVVQNLTGEWADDDPQAAIAWVSRIQNPEVQGPGYASIMERWAREDANAAGAWLNQQPATPVRDYAVEAFANRIAWESPEVALLWAQEIQDEERRVRSTVRTAQALYRQNPDALQNYLPDLGLSEEAQREITNPRRGRGRR
jgi:hypothetical protein